MDKSTTPRTLIFPFPFQSHINSMLKLAELLCLADINIAFLLSCNFHDRLFRHTDIKSRFSKNPGFYLETLPEGICEEHFYTDDNIVKLSNYFQIVAKPFLRKLLAPHGQDQDSGNSKPPITSIIADGILSAALDVAQELGVPIIYFHTISACAFWAYFRIPQLIRAGELPFTGDDMDIPIASVKGMEDFLRRRDLPSFCCISDLTSPGFQLLLNETMQTPRAKGFILNTFDDLEGATLSHIRTQCPNVYTIGPLHAHLKAKLATESTPTLTSSNSLWEEDRSCIKWLEEQPSKSVIYVSFGSITIVTRFQLLEFWHGLVNSGTRFLWAIRPDSITGEDGESKTPEELLRQEGTR